MHLRTAFGVVALNVWHGKDPADGHWGCPIRQRWGLSAHQQFSPALEDKLAYFGTVTVSYEAAAKLAAKVGIGVEDSTIRALVQRLGARAEAQTQSRLHTAPVQKHPQRPPTALAVLMLDGFQVRFRGPGWGKKKTAQARVEWHEEKLGVFYRHEQAVGPKRGQLLEKVVVGWQGQGLELGRRLHWEAQAGGLGRAREVLAVADGAPWIWNVVGDRWSGAHQLLDFYHASQPSVEPGPGVASPRRGQGPGVGGRAVAPPAPRARAGGVEGDRQAALPARRSGQSDPPGTKLFRGPSRANELPKAGAAGLADWQRSGGVSLSGAPMPAQAPRTVLDAAGVAALGCVGRSPRPWSLGSTLAHRLMVVVPSCAPLLPCYLATRTPRSSHCLNRPALIENCEKSLWVENSNTMSS